MIQSGSLTPTALGWVREDLDRELEKIRLQVESIAASPQATEIMIGGAAERVEEVGNIFGTLVLDGAQQIAGEMHKLLQTMGRGRIRDREAANSALLDAMVVLPSYLDRLQAGHQDLPILLLPLMNQMRSVVGEEALTEGTVFSPLLDVELPELEFVRKPGFDEPFEFLTNRLHRQFENALQNWIQEQSEVALLSPMQGICETMRHRVKRYDLKRLWWVATEVFGGLMDGNIDNDVHLRRLMARLSLLIKSMSDQGEDGIDERTSTSITQALLYHVGKARPGCQGVDLVRERFELDKLAPDSDAMMRARGTLSGQDREMYTSLSAAVQDELEIVKDALDLELRTGQVEPDSREQSTEALKRLADTLAMLGLSGPGRTIAALVPAFEDSAAADKQERESALETLAEQLLRVEAALTEQIETLGEPAGEADGRADGEQLTGLTNHELRRIRVKVLDETVISMHAAEDAVREQFSGGPGEQAEEALAQIAGALELISESGGSDSVHALSDLLKTLKKRNRQGLELEQETKEQTADAMAAIELFLAAKRDLQRDTDHYLELATARISSILEGFETPAAAEPGSGSESESESWSETQPESAAEPVPETLSDPVPETAATQTPVSEPPTEIPPVVETPDAIEPDAAAEPAAFETVDEPEPSTTGAPLENDLTDAADELAAAANALSELADAPPTDDPGDTPAGPAPWEAEAPTAAEEQLPSPAPEPTIEPAAAEAEQVEAAAAPATEVEDTLPPEIDPDLREIFLEEYEEVLQTLQSAIPTWINQPDNADALTEIRRAFHTLKGSGRMVGADELGDFSWQIENMLNTLLEGRGENFADSSVMVRLAEASLPALRQRLLQEHAGLTRGVVLAIGACAEQVARNEAANFAGLQPQLPMYLAGLLPDDLVQAAAPAETSEPEDGDGAGELLAMELGANLKPIRELMDAIAQDRSSRATEEQVRAAHSIAGALSMAPEGLDAEVAKALESLLAAQSGSGQPYTPDAMFTVISAVGQLQNRLDRLQGAGDLSPQDEQQELIDQLNKLAPQFDGPDLGGAVAAAPVADDAPSVGAEASEPAFAQPEPESEPDPGPEPEPEREEATPEPFHAETSATEPPRAPAPISEPATGFGIEPAAPESESDAEPDGQDSEQEVEPPSLRPPREAPAEPAGTPAEASPAAQDEAPAAPEPGWTPPEVVQPSPAEAEPAPEPVAAEAAAEVLDPEIVEIFLEEAAEVLERGENALNQWRDKLDDLGLVQELQRETHTFKGGARMAGLMSIGDYSHEMETLLERIAERATSPSVSAIEVLEEAWDRLLGWVEEVRNGGAPQAGAYLGLLKQQIAALDGVTLSPEDIETTAAAVASEEADRTPQPVAEPPESALQAVADPAEDAMSGGSIKVAAELLDRLVNASGEVSIFRSRLEQQIGKLKGNLAEFDETIDRLSEQFRKMDIEIEAQIRANYPDVGDSQGDSFDPLELDQFSALQQATRSLQESVSDLLSLQEMAEENLRASEQLLTRQSRVSTELQEGLMKTRMVPFASIAPKLRSIVRTAARDEGKQARLQLQMVGSSDELDRNVLDHITTPLDHMMRNAVAHGIESPEQRQALDKPAEGAITITVESEATEFVIRIADDGAGINLDAIRRRAVERGLLDEGAEVTQQQLYAFMMDSGFSTSASVTKVAGRGVGMDVVSSEIKQIGGSLEIESEPGQGTQFTIRIPFTLAIMQAIGLEAGDASYLLPLSSVVGVSRIMPDDYRKLLEADEPVYHFAGQDYPVLDIEPLLGERPTPLGRDNVSLLILRAGEQKAAIRAPNLLPHREVVIKPVGPQISSVAGVLGGSISGDGEVMVILDPGPLIRRALIHGYTAPDEAAYAPVTSGKKLVIVVDDSITMRKVTSRVLESHKYEVITARDGVDALEQLQERTPDVMLFDIEMPRMDGYELTERVRDDARFRTTPIMMITSRAGQKHQDRAMQAGANAYLTKPYREDELLAEVERLLDEARPAPDAGA